jgi:hypothetical protein
MTAKEQAAIAKAVEALTDLLPPRNEGYLSDPERDGFAALAALRALGDGWEEIKEPVLGGPHMLLYLPNYARRDQQMVIGVEDSFFKSALYGGSRQPLPIPPGGKR